MRKSVVSYALIALALLGMTAAAGLYWTADDHQLTDKGEYHAPPTRCFFGTRPDETKPEQEAE